MNQILELFLVDHIGQLYFLTFSQQLIIILIFSNFSYTFEILAFCHIVVFYCFVRTMVLLLLLETILITQLFKKLLLRLLKLDFLFILVNHLLIAFVLTESNIKLLRLLKMDDKRAEKYEQSG